MIFFVLFFMCNSMQWFTIFQCNHSKLHISAKNTLQVSNSNAVNEQIHNTRTLISWLSIIRIFFIGCSGCFQCIQGYAPRPWLVHQQEVQTHTKAQTLDARLHRRLFHNENRWIPGKDTTRQVQPMKWTAMKLGRNCDRSRWWYLNNRH